MYNYKNINTIATPYSACVTHKLMGVYMEVLVLGVIL